ncbi:MAG: GAF domain-containing protein [Pseudaminobacter sp.]|nr:GAF domain-containing protein [Pseudaminobacter sp.]
MNLIDGTAAIPINGAQAEQDESRLAVLRGLDTLDTPADADFDRLTSLAATLMQAPIALISLVDKDRLWFKSRYGVEDHEIEARFSFCGAAVAAGDEVLVVEDARADPRFSDGVLVAGSSGIRFYAGAPITVANQRIGMLCVLDDVPRPSPSGDEIEHLKSLAALAASLFSLKDDTLRGAMARAALARAEKRRTVALEAASLASWVWDARTDSVECDLLLPELLNLPPTRLLTADQIRDAIDSRDVMQTDNRFREALSRGDDYFDEYRVRGFDPPRWLASRGRVVERDAAGNAVLAFGVIYDASEQKSTQERQRLLLRELNHRVKNTLATVQALATQTVRHARQPSEFLEAFGARLQALGRAHELLTDHEWRGIDMRELARLELMPFQDVDRPRISVTGSDVLLSPDQALGVGLILHELGENALKYGALSAPAGKVELSWTIVGEDSERKLLVNWIESGGPAVVQPDYHGFGSILIRRSLAKIMASEVKHEFRPEGVTAEITLPLFPQNDEG